MICSMGQIRFRRQRCTVVLRILKVKGLILSKSTLQAWLWGPCQYFTPRKSTAIGLDRHPWQGSSLQILH